MSAPPIVPVGVDAALRFIQSVHGHERAGFAILMLERGDKPPTHYGIDLSNPRWDALRCVLTSHAGADCYISVSLFAAPPQPGRNRTKAMVLHCHWLICEADEHALPDDLPPPTFMVETSIGRFQFWWHMGSPITVAQFEDYVGRIAATVGCNMVKDASRVLRVPGLRNHKPGRGGFMVRVVSHISEASYRLTAFDHLPRMDTPARGGNLPASASTLDRIIAQGGRHPALVSLAGTVRRRGCDEEEVYALLVAVNARRCDPPEADAELHRIARSVCRYAPHDTPRGADLARAVRATARTREEAWAWLA